MAPVAAQAEQTGADQVVVTLPGRVITEGLFDLDPEPGEDEHAAMIFATLIKHEPRLDQAYGSNVLGAVVGGATEYLSMMAGFKALLLVTALFYGLAALGLWRERGQPRDRS